MILLGSTMVPVSTSAMVQVGKYKTHELVFTARNAPANPFDTYLLRLEITDPAGARFTIDGYFDGDGKGGQMGRIWKARIAPYSTGTWSWRTVPGDAIDSDLAGLSGQFEVVESGDVGGVVNDGQHFRFQNGDFVFVQGNFLDVNPMTTHVYMSEDISDAARDAQILRQRDYHASNKIAVYFANIGDYRGKKVTPWLSGKRRMNLAHWKLYDEYIRRFKDNGMLAEMWFFADDSGFGKLSTAVKNRLFRYAMARTSAFSHTMYVIALEWGEGWSQAEVVAAGNYIQAHNPWGRVLSVHNHTDWAFSGESWATFIATQYGFSESRSGVNQLAITMRNNQPIPHIDEEFACLGCGTSSMTARQLLWANFCGGAAGGGTGYGIASLLRFLSQSRAPFQRMEAANNLVVGGGSNRFVLAEAGHHYIVYSETGTFEFHPSGTGLSGQWFNPRDPNADLRAAFSVTAGNQVFTPPTNTYSDWVLWITDGTNLNSGVVRISSGATLTREVVSANKR